MNSSISKFNFLINMKKSTLKFFLIAFFSGIIISFNSESKANTTQSVPACGKNELPSNTGFCSITPTVFKIDLYRAELCISNPIPTGTSTPNYDSSGCITLFDGKGTPSTEDIGNQRTAQLPLSSADDVVPGTYKYLNLVVSSNFRSSASHIYNGKTYRTSGPMRPYPGDTVGTNVTTDPGTPVVTDKFWGTGDEYKYHGWRRKYGEPTTEDTTSECASKERCTLNFYYGNDDSTVYTVTAIIGVVGSDGSFTEGVSDSSNSLFYQNELSSPLTLSADSSGFLDIGIKANVMVQSNNNEDEVMQLNSAPISFDMEFISQ